MVVFVNHLTVVGPVDRMEELYSGIGAYMSAQPGIIRYQLVRSTKQADVYFNIAEWETVEDFQQALRSDEFQSLYATLKPLIKGDAHLSEVVQAGTSVAG